jgi:hypothetical protein
VSHYLCRELALLAVEKLDLTQVLLSLSLQVGDVSLDLFALLNLRLKELDPLLESRD